MLFLYLMFAESTENTGEKVLDKLICESCGEAFACGANAGKCWCFDFELEAQTLNELRDNFNRCLCAACLEKSGEIYTKNTN